MVNLKRAVHPRDKSIGIFFFKKGTSQNSIPYVRDNSASRGEGEPSPMLIRHLAQILIGGSMGSCLTSEPLDTLANDSV